MDKRCDLHCHSTYSDGTDTPAELISLAEKQGLSALALTDHNTAGGLKEFVEAGRKSSVIPVPGCEFTTEWNHKEIHIVGLFFREEYWPEIDDFLELAHLAKIIPSYIQLSEYLILGKVVSVTGLNKEFLDREDKENK
jgi:predicted metal-dependent phosphoesterase TrpH